MSTEFPVDKVKELAMDLGVEPEALLAVAQVESNRGGFISVTDHEGKINLRPKILFEPHVFWRELQKAGKNPEEISSSHPGTKDILYKKWGEQKYGTEKQQWDRLNRAQGINFSAAMRSCSWGFGQIMGFHAESLKYKDVFEFAEDQATYAGQLRSFSRFIKVNGLVKYLVNHDWASFAKAYNGPGYKQNSYDTKIEKAYLRIKREGIK